MLCFLCKQGQLNDELIFIFVSIISCQVNICVAKLVWINKAGHYIYLMISYVYIKQGLIQASTVSAISYIQER